MSKDPFDPSAPGMQKAALRVISNLYGAVTEGADYEPMFFAMDEVIDQVLGEPEIEHSSDVINPLFQPHFDRAAHVFDVMSRQETETPLRFVERRPMATAVVDPSCKILAANTAFEESFASAGDAIGAQFATLADKSRFASLTRANAPDSRAILNMINPRDDQPVSLLAGIVPQIEMQKPGEQALYLMMIRPHWTPSTGDLLRQAYDLSPAEIEILQIFVETGSIQGVAEKRERSIRTIRTQISRIFAQMGITGQTGLALFLATLDGMQSSLEPSAPTRPKPTTQKTHVRTHLTRVDGHRVEVLDYGDPSGDPILLLQSTHPPNLTESVREHLFERGLRILAPLKPGSGRSDTIAHRPGPNGLAPHYAAVMQSLSIDTAIVAGQASGGLYALELAKQFPDRTTAVCLIDTGVPFRDRSELMELPKSIRRTMVPARYFPDLLYLPHRLVAANFRRSPKGEARVVDYFFADSPVERELTRTRRDAYDVTRSLIDYSFDDTERLVRDVSHWAGDWRPLLEEVANTTRLRFFQGHDNRMFRVDRIEAWLDGRNSCDLVTAPTAGQLAAFEHPDLLADALATLVPR